MATLRCIRDQLLASRRLRKGEISVVDAEGVMAGGNAEVEDFYAGLVANDVSTSSSHSVSSPERPTLDRELDSFALRFGMQSDRFIDASTGLPLDEGLCRATRKKEIDYFKNKGVWEIRRINEARAKIGRSPISV